MTLFSTTTLTSAPFGYPTIAGGVTITQGDDVTINMLATIDGSSPMDLTGATLSSTLVASDESIVSVFNSSHTIANQTTNTGEFSIFLDRTTTALLMLGAAQNIVTKASISGKDLFIHANKVLRVVSASPAAK